MSLQEFQQIFKREIENELARLRRKSCESSPGSVTRSIDGSAIMAEGRTGGGALDPAELELLRRLATSMAENVLQRLANDKAWENAGAEPAALAGHRAAQTEATAAKERLEAKCQKLEVELQQKKAELARRSEELFSEFKADCDRVLHIREKEILEIQRAATFDQQDDAAANDSGGAGNLGVRREFVEHVGRIQVAIAETKEAMCSLETKKQGIEKIEAQQSQALCFQEALLAGTVVTDNLADEQDRALFEAIQRGEQVCKRMRRHLAGA